MVTLVCFSGVTEKSLGVWHICRGAPVASGRRPGPCRGCSTESCPPACENTSWSAASLQLVTCTASYGPAVQNNLTLPTPRSRDTQHPAEGMWRRFTQIMSESNHCPPCVGR